MKYFKKMTLKTEDFLLDDLLVNCCKQIINNDGNIEDHENIKYPDSILDWVSGKVLRCLPNLFLKRLLTLILENKDLKSLLKYHQSYDGTKFIFEIYHSEVHKTINLAKTASSSKYGINSSNPYLAAYQDNTKRHVKEVPDHVLDNLDTNAPDEWFSGKDNNNNGRLEVNADIFTQTETMNQGLYLYADELVVNDRHNKFFIDNTDEWKRDRNILLKPDSVISAQIREVKQVYEQQMEIEKNIEDSGDSGVEKEKNGNQINQKDKTKMNISKKIPPELAAFCATKAIEKVIYNLVPEYNNFVTRHDEYIDSDEYPIGSKSRRLLQEKNRKKQRTRKRKVQEALRSALSDLDPENNNLEPTQKSEKRAKKSKAISKIKKCVQTASENEATDYDHDLHDDIDRDENYDPLKDKDNSALPNLSDNENYDRSEKRELLNGEKQKWCCPISNCRTEYFTRKSLKRHLDDKHPESRFSNDEINASTKFLDKSGKGGKHRQNHRILMEMQEVQWDEASEEYRCIISVAVIRLAFCFFYFYFWALKVTDT